MRFLVLMSVVWSGFLMVPVAQAAEPGVGQTRIARWQGDAAGCFMLMFDDSWPSGWQVAAPELVKRGMIGTFYICPGKGEHVKFAKKWDEELWKQGMVYGDHTMTHKGVKDLENAEYEIGECARIIRKITGREGKLVSFGMPGVGPKEWNITPEQTKALLAKYNLIDRPTFVGHGANYHVKSSAEMLGLADKAIAARGAEYLVFHGLERITPNWGYQDMWAVKQDVFFKLLDGLKERRDKGELWITDHISQHQYAAERDAAAVKVLETTGAVIRLELTATTDPRLYDLPLTLITRVPAEWRQVKITQGEKTVTVEANQGAVKYEATPGGGVVTLVKG